MGKYNGLGLFLYLTPNGCRVVEGENRSGTIEIRQYFTVSGISQHFSNAQKDNPAEVTSMSSLVNDIVTEFSNRSVKSRKVFVVSNCFGIKTEIESENSRGGFKDILLSDVSGLNKKKKKTDSNGKAETVNKQTPGTMQSKTVWGDTIRDGQRMKYSTVTTGEKFLLKSLVHEFYVRGYEVIGISNTIGQLMNLWQTEAATFDNPGKVIVDVEGKASIIVMDRDVPINISEINLPKDDISQALVNAVRQKLSQYGLRARVYLTGEYFADPRAYIDTLDLFEMNDIVVYDIFDKPSLDEEKFAAAARGEQPVPITPDYSVCLAELLCPYSKQVVNVVPPLDVNEIIKKNSVVIARALLGVSVAVFVSTGALAGIRAFQKFQMSVNPTNINSMTMQLQTLQTTKAQLEEMTKTLTQADVTILDVMSFVAANQSTNINVISVDTQDMLTTELSVEDTTGAAQAATQAANTAADAANQATDAAGDLLTETIGGGGGSTRAPIIIRGYARSGNAAVEYYDKLFRSGLPEDPVLNGVEKYTLPDGTEAYIFEIQIGGELQ